MTYESWYTIKQRNWKLHNLIRATSEIPDKYLPMLNADRLIKRAKDYYISFEDISLSISLWREMCSHSDNECLISRSLWNFIHCVVMLRVTGFVNVVYEPEEKRTKVSYWQVILYG